MYVSRICSNKDVGTIFGSAECSDLLQLAKTSSRYVQSIVHVHLQNLIILMHYLLTKLTILL